MRKIQHYSISIPQDTPKTLQGVKVLIESHSHIFEDAVMAEYRGDQRYTYVSDNFEVTEIEEGAFTFEVYVSYFEGCKDRDGVDRQEMNVEFEIRNGCIEFDLDETVWNTDN